MEKRKYVTKILIGTLLVVLFGSFVMGWKVEASSDFIMKKDSGDVVLEKYVGKNSVVKIPKNVTIINRAFENNKKIKEVVMSDSVKEVYDGAFNNCPKLKKVRFSNNLKCIEKGAFQKCKGIKEIVIPKKCESIGEWAFQGCINLEKISVQKGNKYFKVVKGALYNKNKTELLLYPKASKKYKTFVIPKSVRIINGDSFVGNKYITKLVFEGKPMEGDIPAFAGMKRLKKVVFKKVYKVPFKFKKCKNLKKIVMPIGE